MLIILKISKLTKRVTLLIKAFNWKKDAKERVYFTRRKPLFDFINRLKESINIEEILLALKEKMIENQWTLFKVSEELKPQITMEQFKEL